PRPLAGGNPAQSKRVADGRQSMSILLDTDICSAYLRGDGTVITRIQQYAGRLSISALTLGELYVWALRRKSPRRHLAGLNHFLSDVTVLAADAVVSRKFGEVRAQLL